MLNKHPKDVGDFCDLALEAAQRIRFVVYLMDQIQEQGDTAEDFDGWDHVCLREILEDVAEHLAGARKSVREPDAPEAR